MPALPPPVHVFFFNDTATTEIYTLSLHDALPICTWTTRGPIRGRSTGKCAATAWRSACSARTSPAPGRSEEHTSELQSRSDLVCRLLLEKKKKRYTISDFPKQAQDALGEKQCGHP